MLETGYDVQVLPFTGVQLLPRGECFPLGKHSWPKEAAGNHPHSPAKTHVNSVRHSYLRCDSPFFGFMRLSMPIT